MKFSYTHINRSFSPIVVLLGILSLLIAMVAPISRYSPTQVVEAAGEALAPATALDEATRARITEALGKVPLSFEANTGQTDERVKFVARGGGYTLFLTATEAVLSLSRREEISTKSAARDTGDRAQKEKSERARRDVLSMKLVGARSAAQVEGVHELPVKSNYFIGNDPKKWRTDVPQYAKVKYTAVYPGVDLVYYGKQRELEYDFIVAPGASPGAIKLKFQGAKGISIDKEGDLILQLEGGEVRQRKPVIYQELAGERREIEGRYAWRRNNEVGFEIGSYDSTKPLVIDPTIVYSTYFQIDTNDRGSGIAVDEAGNAYVTGTTGSTNFPTRNQYQTDQFHDDAFVMKLNTNGGGNGSLLYSTYLGGSNDDEWQRECIAALQHLPRGR